MSTTSKERSLPDPDYGIWILLDMVHRAVREQELREHGVLLMQSTVLNSLVASGELMTPAELARKLRRRPHSVSTILSRMGEAGLVRKVEDPQRRSWIRVAVTASGKKAHVLSTRRESIRPAQ